MLGGILSVLLSFLLPVVVAAYLIMRRSRTAHPVAVGAAACIVLSHLLRMLVFTFWMKQYDWYFVLEITKPAGFSLFNGFLAALMEEAGRWLAFRFLMKRNHRFIDGIAFGAGYGGVESLLIAGINMLAVLFLFGGTPDTVGGIAKGLCCVAGLMLQMVLSVLVLRSVYQKKFYGFAAALVVHTVYDMTSIYYGNYDRIPQIWLAVILVAFSAAAFYLTFRFRKRWRKA